MVDSMFTITEAAKEAKVSRAAIHKAIKAGRLSATKNDDGNYLIDAAELFRVYQPVTSTISKPSVNLVDNISNQLIVQELEFTKQLLKQVESERDNLRVSLNQAMMLITHQPQPEIQQPELQPVKPSLYEKLFGRRS
jgi:predicted DNA-binding protein YlxM (UPF0122 family)